MSAPGQRWAIRQRSRLLAEQCGDRWAIFLAGTGITHLVDFMSGEVLLFLETPRSDDEIVAFVASLARDPSVDWETCWTEVLAPLLDHQLIEVAG